jgi:hypothetical protein
MQWPLRIAYMIPLFLAALATGALMVNWIGLARAMLRISSAPAYTEFHQASSQTFDPYMPCVVIGALLGGILLVVLSPGLWSASGRLAALGCACYAAVMLISLSTNVPMNRRVARWSVQSPPDDWTTLRERWVRWHILRTLISLPGLACYLMSAIPAGIS